VLPGSIHALDLLCSWISSIIRVRRSPASAFTRIPASRPLPNIAEGSVRYEDTNGATGLLPAGGIEWMRAGGGVWHGGGLGEPGRTRGFQLWIALPPEFELGPDFFASQAGTLPT
jgi:hypothetical protein